MKLEIIKDAWESTIRDFTSLGNPLILFVITLSALGLSLKSIVIFIFSVGVMLLSGSIKLILYKERPFKEERTSFLRGMNTGSFPSMHTANATFVFLALISIFPFPKNLLYMILLVIVGLTRLVLKKHYIIDVIAGYFIGMLIFVFWFLVFG